MSGLIARVAGLAGRYRHVNWALADQGMVSSVNFLTGIMLARYLGLGEFGRFTLAWMAVVFVTGLQGALIVSPMMSIGPKQTPGDEPAYYGAVAVQQVVFGIAVFAFVWGGATAAAALFPQWRIGGLALPLASAALAIQCQDFLRRQFFTRGRGAVAFFSDAARYPGQLALLFWLFTTRPMDIATTLWVIAMLAALATLATLPALDRMVWRSRTFRVVAVRHWQSSKWLLGKVLMQLASSQLFIVVAGAMLGAGAVGALRATRNLMGVVNIMFLGLGNVMPIRAARHFQSGGPRALKAYVLRMTILGELAIGAVAAVMFAAPEFWLSLAFGEEFAGYGNLLRWWAVAYMVFFLHQPVISALRAIERTRAIFLAAALSSAFTVVMAYPLISLFDAAGAVAGIAFIQLAGFVVLLVALAGQLSKFEARKSKSVAPTSSGHGNTS